MKKMRLKKFKAPLPLFMVGTSFIGINSWVAMPSWLLGLSAFLITIGATWFVLQTAGIIR